MTQTIEYVVKVNAQDSLGQVERVEAAFAKTDTAAKKAGASIDRATGPTRNLGQAGLEASRAFEDLQYGIGGVINNIPSLVMSFGAGAGVAGAISIAVVAANQLYKSFGSVGDAGKAGADAARSHMEDLKKAIQDADTEMQNLILGASVGRIQAQKMAVEEAASAGKEAQATFRSQFGIDPNDQRAMGMIASQAQGGLDTWVTRWNVQKQEMEKVRVAAKDVMAEYRKVTDAYNVAVDEQVLLRRYEAIEAERIEQLKTDAAIDAANAQEEAYKASQDKKTKDAQKQAEDEAKLRYDLHVAMLDDEDKALEAVRKSRSADRKKQVKEMADEFRDMEKARKEAERAEEKARKEAERAEQLHQSRLESLQGEGLAARMAFDDIATEHSMENLDRLKAHEYKNLKDRVNWQKNFYDDIGNLLKDSTSSAIGLTEEYIAMRIEGAENAEAIVAQKFLAGVGQQLVGVGTKYLFEGAGMSILGDPRGPLILGLGAGAIATGVAMGAGSAAWAHTMNGGQIGKPLPDKDKKDPGASPRRGRDSGGGGPLVVNVTYGAGGPLPEDIAREIDKVVKQNDRRRGAA